MNLFIIALMVVTFVLMTVAPHAEQSSDEQTQTQQMQPSQPNTSNKTDVDG